MLLPYSSVSNQLILCDQLNGSVDSNATVYGSPVYDTGYVTAQAISLGGGTAILYPADYLNLLCGTISFWIKPVDWDPTAETGYDYLYIQTPGNSGMVITQSSAGVLRISRRYVGYQTGETNNQSYYFDTDLVQGDWGLLTFKWIYDVFYYYSNGVLIGKLKFWHELDQYTTRLKLCNQPIAKKSLVNDLRVWNFPLTDSEILTLYSSGATPSIPAKKNKRTYAVFYPGPQKVQVWTDINMSSLQQTTHTVDAYVIKADTSEELLGSLGTFENNIATGVFSLPTDMADGDNIYIKSKIKYGISVVDEITSEVISYIKYSWSNTNVGISDTLISPFTALVYDGTDKKISCYGREYWLKANGLIDHIVSRNESITSEIMLSGNIDGVNITYDGSIVIDSEADGKIVFHSSNTLSNATILISGVIEYDGYLKYTITITPSVDFISLNDLKLTIPVTLANAKLYHVVRESNRANCETDYLASGTGKIWGSSTSKNSGGFTSNVLGSFVPYWWIGDYDRGICWMADSDENWSLSDSDDAIEFYRTSTHVNAIHQIINIPIAITAESPWTISFGLMAGPSRPEPDGWRMNYQYGSSLNFWYNAPAPADNSFEGYCSIPNLADWIIYSTANQPWGVNLAPHDRWGNPGDVPEYDDCYLEWKGGILTTSLMELATKSYTDATMYNMNTLLSNVPQLIQGMFFDDTYPSVDWNLISGKGYIRRDGKRQAGYTMTALRDYFKRAAYLFDYYNCTEIYNVHVTGAVVMPCHCFGNTKVDQEGDYNITTNWIDDLPLGYICGRGMSRQSGVPSLYHAIADESNSTNAGADLVTLCLLHDILSRNDNVPWVTKTTNTWTSFGMGESDVEFLGYWVLQPTGDVTEKDIKISGWKRSNDTALVTVGNLTSSDYTGSIIIPFDLLDISANLVICDGETGAGTPKKYTKLSDSNVVELDILSHDCRILLIGANGVFNTI